MFDRVCVSQFQIHTRPIWSRTREKKANTIPLVIFWRNIDFMVDVFRVIRILVCICDCISAVCVKSHTHSHKMKTNQMKQQKPSSFQK